MLKNIHQSKKYGQYMKKIGWLVEKVDGCQIFIRRFPIIGSLIKIQRPSSPIPFEKIEKLGKKYRAFKIIIEPRTMEQVKKLANKTLQVKRQSKKFGYKKSNSPYLPTKTIYIDLTFPEEKIFNNFSESKRRAVRKAIKNGVVIKESKDINSLIKLKASQFFPLGFLIKKDITALWETFSPKNAILLKAKCYNDTYHWSKPLGGVLLLFYKNTVHYWLAASTKEGKKLFAPTLLVWKALKLAKKRGSEIFDFGGIYDSRFRQATKSWQGFTKFKKGFGGKEIEYPGSFVKFNSMLHI